MNFWDHHKAITCYYELLMSSVCQKYQLRQMEYDILMFLHSNPQHNTAADIVMIRKSTKSHVSVSLKSLERKGLIRRVQNKSNKKRIEITLTDRSAPIIDAGKQVQAQFSKDVLSGLTQEEKDICISIFCRIHDNADECMRNYKEEQEQLQTKDAGSDGGNL